MKLKNCGRIRMAARRAKFLVMAALLAAAAASSIASRAAPALDYEFFKQRVQPIFLQKRDGHTRCYVCHAESNNAFRLERGAVAQELRDGVDPGEPGRSRDQPAAAAAARARGGRQRLSLRRPPVRVQGRPELENSGGLGQRGEAVEPGLVSQRQAAGGRATLTTVVPDDGARGARCRCGRAAPCRKR